MHGESIVELGGALVVEAAAALPVDQVGDVVDVGLVEVVEAGTAGEPPAPGAVLVLDLAALPRRVRVAEPGVDPVGGDEGRPPKSSQANRPLRALRRPSGHGHLRHRGRH